MNLKFILGGQYNESNISRKSINIRRNSSESWRYCTWLYVVDNDLNPFKLSDTKGKRVFLTVPSLDTPVCDTEVRRFNQEAAKLGDVTIYTISMDLPFAQGRWCGGAEIDKVKTVSDYKDREFGKKLWCLHKRARTFI